MTLLQDDDVAFLGYFTNLKACGLVLVEQFGHICLLKCDPSPLTKLTTFLLPLHLRFSDAEFSAHLNFSYIFDCRLQPLIMVLRKEDSIEKN